MKPIRTSAGAVACRVQRANQSFVRCEANGRQVHLFGLHVRLFDSSRQRLGQGQDGNCQNFMRFFFCSRAFAHIVLCGHGLSNLHLLRLSSKFRTRLATLLVASPVAWQATVKAIALLLLGIRFDLSSTGVARPYPRSRLTSANLVLASFIVTKACRILHCVLHLLQGLGINAELSSVIKLGCKCFSLAFQHLS